MKTTKPLDKHKKKKKLKNTWKWIFNDVYRAILVELDSKARCCVLHGNS